MIKVAGWLLFAVFLLPVSHGAFGQMDRKAIKKNNRKVMSFRGKKSNFSKEKRYITLGPSLSALNYYGDLAPNPGRLSTDISFTRPAFGMTLAHRLGPRYSLSAGLMYGAVKGSDFTSADPNDAKNGKFRYYRNLSFRNRIKELAILANFDLFKNEFTYLMRKKWTPYAFAGVTVFHHNPQALAPPSGLDGQPLLKAGSWVNLRKLGTEGQYANLETTDANYGIKPYNLLHVAIPIGIGVRFKINQVVDLSAELGFRYLFTDYIDDVSQNYVDLGVFDSELARALSYRSNELTKSDIARRPVTARNGVTYNVIEGYGHEYPTNIRGKENNKDIFTVTTFRLSYILGKTLHRAKFR